MTRAFTLTRELTDALTQIGMHNQAGWDQLIMLLEHHSTHEDDVYLASGLRQLLHVVRPHRGS